MHPSSVWQQMNSDQTPFVSCGMGRGTGGMQFRSTLEIFHDFGESGAAARSAFVVPNYQLRTYRLDSYFVFSEGETKGELR